MERKESEEKLIRRSTIMRISALLLSILSALSGCGFKPFEKPVLCGGVTDKTDTKAPKVIESKEISEYYTRFLLYGEWSEGHDTDFYTFSIKKDDGGTLTASEATTGVSAPADSELLKGLQDIIDEYKLVGDNGEYRVTAGLPPEFQPCSLQVKYASGEKLNFTHDNDPGAPWAGATYLLFAEWFAEHGEKALLPKDPVYGPLIGISIEYHADEDGNTFYYFANRDDDPPELVRLGTGKHESVLLPGDFFDRVEEIVKHYDLRKYNYRSPLSNIYKPSDPAKAFGGKLQFTLFLEGGDQFHVNADLDSTIDDFMPLLEELKTYFDSLYSD